MFEKDWFCKNPLDAEHKKYVLLAGLQKAEEDFLFKKIYPCLGSIIDSIQSMLSFKQATKSLYERMKEPIGLDLDKMKILYKSPKIDDKIEVLEEIIDYSLPLLKKNAKVGMELHDEVEKSIKWGTIGIVPKYQEEGYLIVHVGSRLSVNRYVVKKVIDNHEEFFGIGIEQIHEENSLLKDYESIKERTIKENPELPCPLFISAEGPDFYPFEESVMPIIKKICLAKIKRLEF